MDHGGVTMVVPMVNIERLTQFLIQEKFNMAVSQFVATGINIKMIKAAKLEAEYRANYVLDYWTMPTDYENVPLALQHLMLSFLIWTTGLGLGLIVFVIESINYKFMGQKVDDNKDKSGGRRTVNQKEKDEKDLLPLVEL